MIKRSIYSVDPPDRRPGRDLGPEVIVHQEKGSTKNALVYVHLAVPPEKIYDLLVVLNVFLCGHVSCPQPVVGVVELLVDLVVNRQPRQPGQKLGIDDAVSESKGNDAVIIVRPSRGVGWVLRNDILAEPVGVGGLCHGSKWYLFEKSAGSPEMFAPFLMIRVPDFVESQQESGGEGGGRGSFDGTPIVPCDPSKTQVIVLHRRCSWDALGHGQLQAS